MNAPALRLNVGGTVVCAHRDLSCCPDCFAATPGLLEVFGEVYRWEPEQWAKVTGDDAGFAGLGDDENARDAILAGRGGEDLRVSPGTPGLVD